MSTTPWLPFATNPIFVPPITALKCTGGAGGQALQDEIDRDNNHLPRNRTLNRKKVNGKKNIYIYIYIQNQTRLYVQVHLLIAKG